MATFVLVHGATAGGWQWRDVAGTLRGLHQAVHTPTLTGLGERSHLITPHTDLDTHIRDIVNVIRYEELYDVVLVGKSYSGMVITGVAEQIPERLRRLIYLNALVPEDGQSFLDILGPQTAQHIRAAVELHGQGWRLPADSSANPRLTDHPFASLSQPLRLASPAARAISRAYIWCIRQPPNSEHTRATMRAAQRAQHEGWIYRELPADHDPEQTMPQAVAELLIEVAGA